MLMQQLAKAKRKYFSNLFSDRPVTVRPAAMIEGLENRQLMHGGHHDGFGGPGGFGDRGRIDSTITFDQAPAAVQTGLTTLATTDNVAAPTSDTNVRLGNFNGLETYTVVINGTGTITRLTVDQNGNAVTAPTVTTTTFGALTNTAVTSSLTAIAAGLGLTAPASDTAVVVTTAADGSATYSVHLADASTTDTTTSGRHHHFGQFITVDSNGVIVGNSNVPLSLLSQTIQDALKAAAPSGATALTDALVVKVRTLNGQTTYSVDYTSSGTTTTVTVDKTGAAATLPSATTVDFSTLPTAAQTELQTLATAEGVTATIDAGQDVTKYDEGNGTVVYSVTLAATDSTDSTRTYNITLSTDQAGNPTVPPGRFGFGDFGGFGGFRGDFGGGGFGGFGGGGCDNDGSTTTTTTGTTTTSTTPTSTSTAATLVPALASAASSTTGTTTTTSDGTTSTTTSTKKSKKHKAKKHKHRH